METTRLINTETGIEAIIEAVNDKRGAFKLTLVKQAQRAVV